MSRAKPPLVPLHQLTPGDLADCFAVLAGKTKGATRDGKPYFSCRFRDTKRTVVSMIWADGPWFETCERDWHEGQFYKLRGVYGEHERYGPQLELHNLRPVTEADRADGFDPCLLIESSRFDIEELFAQLTKLAETRIQKTPVRQLVLTLLQRHAGPIKALPASEKFHPFRGGWLEHVVSVTQSCLILANHYETLYPDMRPPLDRDLIVAGAILHDLGRVLEWTDDPAAPQPTVPGKLLGHLVLGRDLVRDAAREVPELDPRWLQLLEHLILSHLALPEWGSPRLPLIPECLILHHADDLDAKMEMYARCLSRDVSPGPFTARDPVLGKQLLKQRSE